MGFSATSNPNALLTSGGKVTAPLLETGIAVMLQSCIAAWLFANQFFNWEGRQCPSAKGRLARPLAANDFVGLKFPPAARKATASLRVVSSQKLANKQ